MDDPWRSRGYLPHADLQALQSITFRLADALPDQVLAHLLERCPTDDAVRRRQIEAYLDAGHGSCLLGQDAYAEIVESCLLARDGLDYRLLAWVIMPNHVHVLIDPLNELAMIVQAWKSVSAHRILPLLVADRPRVLWQREYWDRFIRDERHRQHAMAYIHANPVTAGLVAAGAEWRWGSARRHASPGAGARPAPDAGEGAGAPGGALPGAAKLP
jgi:putative transposase